MTPAPKPPHRAFSPRSVAITGGATGIGFALAKRLGSGGDVRVAIGEPRPERLEAGVAQLRAAGVDARGLAMDVTDPAQMERFAEFVWTKQGAADLLINNAGVILEPRALADQPIDEIRRLFDVNFFGVVQGCGSFGPRMVAAGAPAAIYNVGSENSFFPAAPNIAAYVASKHAVRGLTVALREEYPDHVTIGLICPGFVKSEMTAPPFGDLAMDTDAFAAMAVEQILARETYVVSRSYNVERFRPIHAEIEAAYARAAPRSAGDERFDVRHLIEMASKKERLK
ncbi:MAG: SDR family oxidoreductase [Pseudomonadota bacterium]